MHAFTRPIARERRTLAGIPVLDVHAATLAGPAPTVLFYHGWASHTAKQLVTAEALACEGLRVLLPDLPHHGDRPPLVERHELAAKFWPVIFAAIAEAPALVQAAVDAGLADPERIGIGGDSAGGVAASGAFAQLPALKVLALDCSCPSYVWLEEISRAARGDGPIPPDLLAQLQALDPAALVARIAPRPVLLLHGDADSTLPIEGMRRFLAAAQPHYAAHPERLRSEEWPRLNHYMTVGMVSEIRDWFAQHLLTV